VLGSYLSKIGHAHGIRAVDPADQQRPVFTVDGEQIFLTGPDHPSSCTKPSKHRHDVAEEVEALVDVYRGSSPVPYVTNSASWGEHGCHLLAQRLGTVSVARHHYNKDKVKAKTQEHSGDVLPRVTAWR
jgi:hypothetical protein